MTAPDAMRLDSGVGITGRAATRRPGPVPPSSRETARSGNRARGGDGRLPEDLPKRPIDRRLVVALAATVVLALAVRAAAAQGALWLDEAWSAVFARQAATPAGVFFAINHDNNHFANTLWLQVTGWGAPPILSRGLSILSGTAAVVVGSAVGVRRGPAAALATAIMLAMSPILVVYGAEARGYAPMLLGLIVSVAVLDRWLFVGSFRAGPYILGTAAAFGTLGHLTMAIGIVAIAGWFVVVRAQRSSAAKALVEMLELMRWALAAAVAIIALVLIVAIAHAHYRIGAVAPFSWGAYAEGLDRLIAFALGFPGELGPLAVAGAAVFVTAALWAVPAIRDRAPFYAMTILLFPAAVALFSASNSGFPRYFLITGLGLILFAADLIGIGWQRGGWRRAVSAAALAAFCIGSAALDARAIQDRRSDPGEAIAAMAGRARAGATAIIDNPRSYAVLAAAAASSGYPLAITEDRCSGAPFLFVDEDFAAPLPAMLMRCRVRYHGIAGRSLNGLSGLTWRLYARTPRAAPAG